MAILIVKQYGPAVIPKEENAPLTGSPKYSYLLVIYLPILLLHIHIHQSFYDIQFFLYVNLNVCIKRKNGWNPCRLCHTDK